MGGLFKRSPVVGWTFLIGTLAIIGVPGLSGFFSKDEILWMALATQNPVAWVFGSLAAVFTSFYMIRLLALTFFGDLRTESHASPHHDPTHSPGKAGLHASAPPHAKPAHHASHDSHDSHDSHAIPQKVPAIMTIPLVLLAILSLVGGWVGIPHLLGHRFSIHNTFHDWLTPVFSAAWSVHPFSKVLSGLDHHPPALLPEGTAMLIAIGGMLLGSSIALLLYTSRAKATMKGEAALQNPRLPGFGPALFRLVYNKYYVDEIYQTLLVQPLVALSRYGLWAFDKLIVDGLVNLVGLLARVFGQTLSWFQSGNVKVYLFSMAVGLASLLLWLTLSGLPF